MNSSSKIALNTAAQYSRTIINVCLSLYSTRLILLAIGKSDYGIYTLIGGIVALLSFVTSALVISTQRYISYYQSRNDINYIQQIFGNSLAIHTILCIIIIIAFESIAPLLFNGFLNISPDRIYAAKIVYQCALTSLIIAFMNAPFRALLIAHENLVFISIVDVINGIVKVGIAVFLTYCESDKLITYALLMLSFCIIEICAYVVYDFRHYAECTLKYIFKINKKMVKGMTSFIGWTIYSTLCILGRTQGTAIVLNKFFGTVINAAFGIAFQINGAVGFISESVLNAVRPQIIKAEGAGDRTLMLLKASTASKLAFLLLALLAAPIITFMPYILEMWLKDVPEGATIFSRLIIITALIDQLTMGLGTANQAIGNIRNYSLTVNTIKLLTVPAILVLLLCGVPLSYAIWVYALFEFVCAMVRLPFLHITGGLDIRKFCADVFCRELLPFALLVALYALTTLLPVNLGWIILYSAVITCVYLASIYLCGLTRMEKELADRLALTLLCKLKLKH